MDNNFKQTLFPVKEVPAVGRHLDEKVTLLDNTGYKFIIREDTNEVLSCMTNEYKLIKNEEIIDKAIPIRLRCLILSSKYLHLSL